MCNIDCGFFSFQKNILIYLVVGVGLFCRNCLYIVPHHYLPQSNVTLRFVLMWDDFQSSVSLKLNCNSNVPLKMRYNTYRQRFYIIYYYYCITYNNLAIGCKLTMGSFKMILRQHFLIERCCCQLPSHVFASFLLLPNGNSPRLTKTDFEGRTLCQSKW